MDIVLTIAGFTLLVAASVEAFLQLFHPEQHGTLSRAIFRVQRAVARRLGRRAILAAGPLSLVSVLLLWIGMTVAGWVLILVPRMPEQVAYDASIDRHSALLDAVYVSLVGIATLGYGDIVPESAFLRIALPLEAAMGFGLFTAGLAWILSTFRPLANQRSFARLAHLHLAGSEPLDRTQLDEFTRRVTEAGLDVKLSPATYYLHPAAPEESVADAARLLHAAALRSRAEGGEHDRRAADRLLRAIEVLTGEVVENHLRRARGLDVEARLRTWCSDGRSGLAT